jgi:hypothetical protein
MVLPTDANQSLTIHFPLRYNFGDLAHAVPFKHRYDLKRHFVRHGEEFGTKTADEYERLADAFMMGPLRDGALECSRDGDLVRFDPGTNEFGVLTTDGHIATFMVLRPLPSDPQTPLQYFQSNCK